MLSNVERDEEWRFVNAAFRATIQNLQFRTETLIKNDDTIQANFFLICVALSLVGTLSTNHITSWHLLFFFLMSVAEKELATFALPKSCYTYPVK